jgi:hypothetical protein
MVIRAAVGVAIFVNGVYSKEVSDVLRNECLLAEMGK